MRVSADPAVYEQQLGALFPGHRAGIASLFRALGEADLGVRGWDAPPAAALRWLGRTLAEVVREHVADDRFLAVFSPLFSLLVMTSTLRLSAMTPGNSLGSSPRLVLLALWKRP